MRRKPQAGDRRFTKAHGMQIRVPRYSNYNQAYVVSSGRQLYEWRTVEQVAQSRFRYLLSIEELERHPEKMKAGYMQMRGAA